MTARSPPIYVPNQHTVNTHVSLTVECAKPLVIYLYKRIYISIVRALRILCIILYARPQSYMESYMGLPCSPLSSLASTEDHSSMRTLSMYEPRGPHWGGAGLHVPEPPISSEKAGPPSRAGAAFGGAAVGGPTCCGFRELSLGSAAVARGVEPPSV